MIGPGRLQRQTDTHMTDRCTYCYVAQQSNNRTVLQSRFRVAWSNFDQCPATTSWFTACVSQHIVMPLLEVPHSAMFSTSFMNSPTSQAEEGGKQTSLWHLSLVHHITLIFTLGIDFIVLVREFSHVELWFAFSWGKPAAVEVCCLAFNVISYVNRVSRVFCVVSVSVLLWNL